MGHNPWHANVCARCVLHGCCVKQRSDAVALPLLLFCERALRLCSAFPHAACPAKGALLPCILPSDAHYWSLLLPCISCHRTLTTAPCHLTTMPLCPLSVCAASATITSMSKPRKPSETLVEAPHPTWSSEWLKRSPSCEPPGFPTTNMLELCDPV